MAYALLIDDDQALVETIQALVRKRGLELDTAATWDEGIALFNAQAHKVVIADYNLPGSRLGLKLLFEISRVNPSVRLVLFSAYVTERDVDEIRNLGLLDRVFRKLDPIETAGSVLEEITRASETANDPTDWVAFAKAAQRARSVDAGALEALDARLRSQLPPSTPAPNAGSTDD